MIDDLVMADDTESIAAWILEHEKGLSRVDPQTSQKRNISTIV